MVHGFMKYFTSPENIDFALHDPRLTADETGRKFTLHQK